MLSSTRVFTYVSRNSSRARARAGLLILFMRSQIVVKENFDMTVKNITTDMIV